MSGILRLWDLLGSNPKNAGRVLQQSADSLITCPLTRYLRLRSIFVNILVRFIFSNVLFSECVDHPLYTSFCERKATEHMCWAHADFMDIYCPKSCERCD